MDIFTICGETTAGLCTRGHEEASDRICKTWLVAQYWTLFINPSVGLHCTVKVTFAFDSIYVYYGFVLDKFNTGGPAVITNITYMA